MKRNSILSAVFILSTVGVLVAQYSRGTPQEVGNYVSQTFLVENMSCAACPITVRKAMSRVDGVQKVDVNFRKKTVTATYDPKVADAEKIAEASTAVGFPAHANGNAP